ncbi:MAG: hypothetical protein IT580_20765, partial [Verrucomicrobiales bacterium]|nr:hypothetical protein [Verrucomicrobiales bacterium]
FMGVSGAVALIYQVVWQRQLALLLGSAAAATAAVVAAFFAGLGLGSLLLGAWVKRQPRPLRAYAILELAIGLGALAVTPILTAFELQYPWWFAHMADHPTLFTAAKTVAAFAAIALPSMAMGGTLPAITQWLDHGPRHLGQTAGALYAANTVGAAAGALAVPFFLWPRFGLSGAVLLGVAGNVALAAAAWWLDRGSTPGPLTAHRIAPPSRLGSHSNARGVEVRQPLILAAFSGLLTTCLQVQWNRAFAQVHENSMHAFAVIAAVVILALAAGAQTARAALWRGFAPQRVSGLAWLAGGILAASTPWLFLAWTDHLAYLPTIGPSGNQAVRLLALSFGMIFLPMALLGVCLPALAEAAGHESRQSASVIVGRLFAANIAGCVLGALAAGFVLPRIVGLWTSLVLTAGAAALLGLAVLSGQSPPCRAVPTGSRGRLVWLLSVVALAIALASAARLPRVRVASTHGERLLGLTEGAHGIVSVLERAGSRRLKLNNHYALGGTLSLGDQRLQSHLPLLLHPDPRRIAVLGLGTGISAGGTQFHDFEQIEVIELVPEVIEAARTHFRDATAGLFNSPRLRLIPEDARNYLRGSGTRYDVVLGDLIVPWRQGEGALFTREHFRAARTSLQPGGLFCQWIPLFQVSEPEFQILARTFLEVFPVAQVWRGDFSPTQPAIAFIGGVSSTPPDPAHLARRVAAMRPDPANPHLVHPSGLWLHFVGTLTPDDLDPRETRTHTEDQPWIELLGPLHHAGERSASLFVGRPLQRWLETLRAKSESRLTTLGSNEWAAVRAGERLFEFSLLLQEQRGREAQAVREEIMRTLPAEVVRGIFGGGGTASP